MLCVFAPLYCFSIPYLYMYRQLFAFSDRILYCQWEGHSDLYKKSLDIRLNQINTVTKEVVGTNCLGMGFYKDMSDSP